MKRSSCNRIKIMSMALGIVSLLYIRKRMSGKTVFISSGIKVDYPFINLENSEVTAYITYKGKTYMRIQYNVLTEETKVNGSIESIKGNRLLKNRVMLNDADFVEMVQCSAQFFIDNEVTDVDAFYRQN
ncbi:hypothetical protein [Lysinibacillus sp. 38-6]|uniref:hypothetical protein n=1 Tax=Lysinibacillus sp. 38-6 TaxID=3385991 RepID=UPI0039088C56